MIPAFVGAAVGAVGLVVAAPAVLTAAGFTSMGIAAKSIAAWMMSSTAIANGGGIGAGSLVALLQSIGAAGFASAGTAVLGFVGATVGGVTGYVLSFII